MLLASPRLRVSHVSTHCSMLQAVAAVTTERVSRVARLTAELVRDFLVEKHARTLVLTLYRSLV